MTDLTVLSPAAFGLNVEVVVRLSGCKTATDSIHAKTLYLNRVALQDGRVDRRASALHLVFAQQSRVLVAVGRRHAAAVAERPDSHRLAYLVVWDWRQSVIRGSLAASRSGGRHRRHTTNNSEIRGECVPRRNRPTILCPIHWGGFGGNSARSET